MISAAQPRSRLNEKTVPTIAAAEQFTLSKFMCRKRARLADKESNYRLAEAEEWARSDNLAKGGRLAQANHQDLRKKKMSRLVPSQGGYGGSYFGGRSSPENQAVICGRCSGSI
jgi:hypothetical protein